MRARQPLKATNMKTREIRIFSSSYAAAKILNLNQASISRCANGFLKTTGGWKFEKLED